MNNVLFVHGLTCSPKNIDNIHKIKIENNNILVNNNNKLLITLPEANSFYLKREFIEWFVGFVDGASAPLVLRTFGSKDEHAGCAPFGAPGLLRWDKSKNKSCVQGRAKDGKK